MSLEQVKLASEKYWETAFSQEQTTEAEAIRLYRNRRALRSFSVFMLLMGFIYLASANGHLLPSILEFADRFFTEIQNGLRALLLHI